MTIKVVLLTKIAVGEEENGPDAEEENPEVIEMRGIRRKEVQK